MFIILWHVLYIYTSKTYVHTLNIILDTSDKFMYLDFQFCFKRRISAIWDNRNANSLVCFPTCLLWEYLKTYVECVLIFKNDFDLCTRFEELFVRLGMLSSLRLQIPWNGNLKDNVLLILILVNNFSSDGIILVLMYLFIVWRRPNIHRCPRQIYVRYSFRMTIFILH